MLRVGNETYMGHIYKITNLINGKVYIGQTVLSLKSRWNRHKRGSGCRYLYNAIVKYGIKNFKIEEIELVPVPLLDTREIYWISKYLSTNRNLGYNIESGGRNGRKNLTKLSEKLKQELLDLYLTRTTNLTKLGRLFNMDRRSIRELLKREQVYHKVYKTLDTIDNLEDIKEWLFAENPTALEASNKYKCSKSFIFRIAKLVGYRFLTNPERIKLGLK